MLRGGDRRRERAPGGLSAPAPWLAGSLRGARGALWLGAQGETEPWALPSHRFGGTSLSLPVASGRGALRWGQRGRSFRSQLPSAPFPAPSCPEVGLCLGLAGASATPLPGGTEASAAPQAARGAVSCGCRLAKPRQRPDPKHQREITAACWQIRWDLPEGPGRVMPGQLLTQPPALLAGRLGRPPGLGGGCGSGLRGCSTALP